MDNRHQATKTLQSSGKKVELWKFMGHNSVMFSYSFYNCKEINKNVQSVQEQGQWNWL